MAEQKPPDFLTLPEVAEHYRTTEKTVRWWRQTGFGPRGVKHGARVLWPRAEIERYDRELQQLAVQERARSEVLRT